MFSRRRPDPAPPTHPEARPLSGKGRPTPSRKEAEAARRRPLVPADRKAAARSDREAARVRRDREYQAMQAGDERFLPSRDKGPVRRWVRDYVDARRNLGEYFLPISIVMVFAVLLAGNRPTLYLSVILALYVVVLATIVDGFILSRLLKRKLVARFGPDALQRGILMYGVLRAFQIRRMRLPKPQVTRGAYPA